MIRIPRAVRALAAVFHDRGHSCYLVGGAVRDMLMKRPTGDYDVATDADPRQVTHMFRRVIPTGVDHGTVTVLFHGTRFEVTTFRVEGDYHDGRRPVSVTFTPSIEEDLGRRDFTMNAIAYDLRRNRIVDPFEGRRDIRASTIRAIGDAPERFREDGLRLMRACRFAAQLGFTVEPLTLQAMAESADRIKGISAERIRDEISRSLSSELPSIAFELMRRTRVLPRVLPELEEGLGVQQPALHCYDVYHHSIYCCDAAPRDDLVVRLAALLHDVGKPRAAARGPEGAPTFHSHEVISADMAREITRRLKYPNRIVDAVAHLVRHHMFHYTEEWSDAAVRRFVARVGRDSLAPLLALRRADQVGTCGRRYVSGSLIALQKRIEAVLEASEVLTVRDLAVDGNAVMHSLGIPPGPLVGRILEELLDAVLADPRLNTQEQLLQMAGRLYEQRIRS